MSPTDPDVIQIERHIKVFLSCCQRFCDVYFRSDVLPFWANTSNFPSLLNLPAQIAKFGPVCWYWEGTRARFIQSVKKILVSMRKTTSYFVRKMEVMQKLTTMEWISEQIRSKNTRNAKSYPRMFYRYESLEEIEDKLMEGQVLSGLTTMKDENNFLEDHIWLVFGRMRSMVSIVPMRRKHDVESETLIGHTYHKYELQRDMVMGDMSTDELRGHASDYCIMLPLVVKENEIFGDKYSVVFDDWDVIDQYGDKNLPTLCQKEFSKDVKRG